MLVNELMPAARLGNVSQFFCTGAGLQLGKAVLPALSLPAALQQEGRTGMVRTGALCGTSCPSRRCQQHAGGCAGLWEG